MITERMEMILDSYTVKICIEKEELEPNTEFNNQPGTTKPILIQCIANSHLECVFQRKTIASQLYLRKKLLTLKFEQIVREVSSSQTGRNGHCVSLVLCLSIMTH